MFHLSAAFLWCLQMIFYYYWYECILHELNSPNRLLLKPSALHSTHDIIYHVLFGVWAFIECNSVALYGESLHLSTRCNFAFVLTSFDLLSRFGGKRNSSPIFSEAAVDVELLREFQTNGHRNCIHSDEYDLRIVEISEPFCFSLFCVLMVYPINECKYQSNFLNYFFHGKLL